MKKESFISNLTASVTLAAGSVWIGSYLLKLFLIFQFFEAEDMSLRSDYANLDLTGALSVLLPAFITPFSAFLLMIVSMLLFLVSSRLSLKNNGWLFISAMIVILTLPFEVYLMLIDYKIISAIMHQAINQTLVIDLIRDRITHLSSFPLIELFAYITILFLIIFKPLTIKNEDT